MTGQMLLRLAQSKDNEMMLTLLAHDCNPAVRSAVAANPATPDHVIAYLSADEHGSVRAAAITRQATEISGAPAN